VRERCNELCTKSSTGRCALCDALDERDRFERPFWLVVTPCLKGMHWLRAHATPVLLTVVSLCFLAPLTYAWWLQLNQLDQRTTCNAFFGPSPDFNNYVQIELTEHYPSEPVFSGKLFFLSADPRNDGVSTVTIIRSKKRSYAQSQRDISTIWDKSLAALRPQALADFDLITETGSHQQFPFDSARFNFELDINPPIEFKTIRIVNRVPGFTMNCSTLQGYRPNARTLQIHFGLDRNLIIWLFVIMLVVASVGFFVLIFLTAQIPTLATSMAAFFFSLWTMRRILEPLMKTFPTLFDNGMLTICILALLCVSWKLYFLKRPKPDL
jgi:hypothetical protein